ncbi:MAG: hypothetical protein K1X53_13210 [Candidatus Sumerlaeaceae bacterium]|nr:hypothetical protein [Candidatus Sumerlaeaceae bacterium]
MKLTRLITTAALACMALPAPGADVSPKSVKATAKDGVTYFQVEFSEPSDFRAPQGNFWVSPKGIVRAPMLLADPVWSAPTYPVQHRDSGGFGTVFEFMFLGRVGSDAAAKPLKFKLTYPTSKGEWATSDITLDLAKAEKPGPADELTSGTEKSGPAGRFAQARADWFRYAGSQLGDPLGFFAFGRTQAEREAGSSSQMDGDFNPWRPRNIRRSDEMLYEMFTGSRAIQESLQVDRMLGNTDTTAPRKIPVSSLSGVPTKSHPFEEMLKGREPKFSKLTGMVPGDQYYMRFANVAKLQELMDFSQAWGSSLIGTPEMGDSDRGLRSRLQKQICLPSSLLSKLLGPALIAEVTVTGSDPFFREGTDITAIFDLKSADAFRAAVDKYWKDGQTENPGAKADKLTTLGVEIESITTADRTVSAYRVFDKNVAIYSNSLPALVRVLETRAGKVPSLESQLDFKYMRAESPEDEKAEDGFLYLSDAFIRRLTGPEIRIASKRRLEAVTTLRMVANAAMLHGYLNGPGKTPTLDDLKKEKLLTDADITDPGAGKITWDAATATASSSIYNTQRFLTPLCEVPVGLVTEAEKNAYEQFRNNYQNYWRRYFDPIGIRIKVDKTISFEITILPLINDTAYNELKRIAGDKTEKFDLSRITTSTLVRWQVRLDPEGREARDGRRMLGGMLGRDETLTDWIGQWGTFWMEDGQLPRRLVDDFFQRELDVSVDESPDRPDNSLKSFFQAPIAGGVQVKNRLSLTAFLVALQGMANTAAPNMVRFVPQPSYNGTTFVKVAPVPGGEIDRELNRRDSEKDAETTAPELALWYAAIGDAWYLTTQESVLRGIVDAENQRTANKSAGREIEYSAFMVLSPSNAVKFRPTLVRGLQLLGRSAERGILADAWLVYRCGLAGADGAGFADACEKYLGGSLNLPSKGKISYDTATDQAVSSELGPMRTLRVMAPAGKSADTIPAPYDSVSMLRAWLRFTEHGVVTNVEIERK